MLSSFTSQFVEESNWSEVLLLNSSDALSCTFDCKCLVDLPLSKYS